MLSSIDTFTSDSCHLLPVELRPPIHNQYAQTPVTVLNPDAANPSTREQMMKWRGRDTMELWQVPWTAASALIYRVEITDRVDSQGDEIWRLQVIAGERKHDPLAGLLTIPGGRSTFLTEHELHLRINTILSYYFLNPYDLDLIEEAFRATFKTSTDQGYFFEPVHLTVQRELLEETGINIPFIDFVKAPLCVHFYEEHTLLLFVINSSVDYLSNLEPLRTESDLANSRWVDVIYFIPRTGEIRLNYAIRDSLVPSLAQMIRYLMGFFDTTVPYRHFNI